MLSIAEASLVKRAGTSLAPTDDVAGTTLNLQRRVILLYALEEPVKK